MFKALLIKLGLATKPVNFRKKLDFCEVLSASDWYYCIEAGLYVASGGDGYWMTDTENQSDVSAWEPRPIWATHVAWYNK